MPESKTFTPAVIKKMMEISPDRPYSLKEVQDRYNEVLAGISDSQERKAFQNGFQAYARGEERRGDDIYDDVGGAAKLVIDSAGLAVEQPTITGVPKGQRANGVILSASYLTRLQVDRANGSRELKPGGELAIQFKNATGDGMCTAITVAVQKRPDGRLETGQERVEPSSFFAFGAHDAKPYDRPIVKRVEVGPCPGSPP